tara:strand:+ start:554 stop:724 length:171 start_codon:yes stop_codon:yes gene_type:complete
MEYTTEEIIEQVRGDIYALTNFLTEINEQYDLDMWDEVIEYLKEKRECDENYHKSK